MAGFRNWSPLERLMRSRPRNNQKSWGFLDSWGFWLRVFTDWLSGGKSDRNNPSTMLGSDTALGNGDYFYGSNRVFTKQGVKKMYFIRSMPEYMPVGWVDDLRDIVSEETNAYNIKHGTKYVTSVNLNIRGDYFNFTYENRKIQGMWRQMARLYNRVQRQAQGRPLEDELHSNRHDLSVQRKVNSYLYMKHAKEDKRSGFFNATSAIELVIKIHKGQVGLQGADAILNHLENRINDYFKQEEIKAPSLFLQANEYQKAYTPASAPNHQSLLKQMNKGGLVTDEVLASYTTVAHGRVGDNRGVFHGIDVMSGEDVEFALGESSGANNILVTAATGEGKSGYTKMLFTYLALDPNFQTVVFDYEGTEYAPLGRVFDAKFVSFSGTSGSYINTMVIPDAVGDREIDESRYITATESTERVFDVLCDDNLGMNSVEQSIFSRILSVCYVDAGVDMHDPNTWDRSKSLTYYDFYLTLQHAITDTKTLHGIDPDDYGGVEALKAFKIKLSTYFEASGSHSHWFKNPISVGEVLDAKNVIFSFNGDQKTGATASSSDKQLTLLQMFASELTLQKARKNKPKGIFTVTMIEELQRYIKLPFSAKIIDNMVTGGRKMNLINYLITNSPDALIKQADMGDENNNAVSDIIGNITMQIVGALDSNNMAALINRFELDNAVGYLKSLVDVKETGSKNASLKYTFFIHRGGQSTMVKMLIHPDLAELPLYKTVQQLNDDDSRTATSMEDSKVNALIGEAYENYSDSENREMEKRRLQASASVPKTNVESNGDDLKAYTLKGGQQPRQAPVAPQPAPTQQQPMNQGQNNQGYGPQGQMPPYGNGYTGNGYAPYGGDYTASNGYSYDGKYHAQGQGDGSGKHGLFNNSASSQRHNYYDDGYNHKYDHRKGHEMYHGDDDMGNRDD